MVYLTSQGLKPCLFVLCAYMANWTIRYIYPQTQRPKTNSLEITFGWSETTENAVDSRECSTGMSKIPLGRWTRMAWLNVILIPCIYRTQGTTQQVGQVFAAVASIQDLSSNHPCRHVLMWQVIEELMFHQYQIIYLYYDTLRLSIKCCQRHVPPRCFKFAVRRICAPCFRAWGRTSATTPSCELDWGGILKKA